MKPELPDIDKFERIIFKKKNTLDRLLSFSLKLMRARQVGLLLGTNRTLLKYLPPEKWDRGVMHKFNGRGFRGLLFKYFGRLIVQQKGLSPVMLYRDNQFGERQESDGIISFVLRKHKDFYRKGVKVLIIDNLADRITESRDVYTRVSILSYNGSQFEPLQDLKLNTAIVRQFRAQNFVSAYIPDYGAIVFNTIDESLLEKRGGGFIREADLKKRLDMLIFAIEMASLAHIGFAKGKQAAHVIWRKEKGLRKTALKLKKKETELKAQREYLRAVGAVDEQQLNMDPVIVQNGVYAFMDMVGSVLVRKYFYPRDYFYILNLCHQIAADNAGRFGCRVDNFIGDAVFFENAAPFDEPGSQGRVSVQDRLVLMVFALSSIFNEIQSLAKGRHNMDREGRVKKLLESSGVKIQFRAGLEMGSALIGPLGSDKRRIVTAIGEAVNTASRLESSGLPDQIHTSPAVMSVLKTASVSQNIRRMPWIQRDSDGDTPTLKSGGIDFFDCFRKQFNLDQDPVSQHKNIRYKEFSQDISYTIRCVPD